MHKVKVETLDELINGVLVLSHYFHRLFLAELEAVEPLLEVPVLFCLDMLLRVPVYTIKLGPLY